MITKGGSSFIISRHERRIFVVWEGYSSNREEEFQVRAGPCFRKNVERKVRTRARQYGNSGCSISFKRLGWYENRCKCFSRETEERRPEEGKDQRRQKTEKQKKNGGLKQKKKQVKRKNKSKEKQVKRKNKKNYCWWCTVGKFGCCGLMERIRGKAFYRSGDEG